MKTWCEVLDEIACYLGETVRKALAGPGQFPIGLRKTRTKKNSVLYISKMDGTDSKIIFVPDHDKSTRASFENDRGVSCPLDSHLDCDCAESNVRGMRDSIFTSVIAQLIEEGWLKRGDSVLLALVRPHHCDSVRHGKSKNTNKTF